MGEPVIDLQAPLLLLAMPQVQDPFFHRSVVLLLHHTDEGSFGLIINRPTEIQVTEILDGMEISWQGDREALAYFGGPVQSQTGTVIYGAGNGGGVSEGVEATTAEVVPGIRVTRHLGDLDRLADKPPALFRLFLGYAGWGAGQLMSELLRNDWLMAPVLEELLFASDPEEVWESALQAVGVDPASLPAWTSGRPQGPTN